MCRRLVKMLHKGSGVGTYFEGNKKAIRLVNRGCTNRPFYHIVVAEVNQWLLHFYIVNSKCQCLFVCLFVYLLTQIMLSIPEFSRGKGPGNRTSRLIWSNVKWIRWKIGGFKFWTNSMVVGRRCRNFTTGCSCFG